MAIYRSCGARETWLIEYYKHPAPLALRSDDADSNELLFAQPSANILKRTISGLELRPRNVLLPWLEGLRRSEK
jgi:hypothetical protein